jgi:archaemetzincin
MVIVLSASLMSVGCDRVNIHKFTQSKRAAWHQDNLDKTIRLLAPLHEYMDKPGPYDWLANRYEAGQSFMDYRGTKKKVKGSRRTVIYIQPLDSFNSSQEEILGKTSEYLGLFYNRPVKILPKLELGELPAGAERKVLVPGEGPPGASIINCQLNAQYIIMDVLKSIVPDDAAALLAFTSKDLWPGGNWNYVFGYASTMLRVGVWSLYRFGNPEKGPGEYDLCLLRTLKLASHETGHMFGFAHCINYKCNMNGINSLEEADRYPMEVCPECMAKVCWFTEYDPEERFQKLMDFCRKNQLNSQADTLEASLKIIHDIP